jgi:hypothetical protein
MIDAPNFTAPPDHRRGCSGAVAGRLHRLPLGRSPVSAVPGRSPARAREPARPAPRSGRGRAKKLCVAPGGRTLFASANAHVSPLCCPPCTARRVPNSNEAAESATRGTPGPRGQKGDRARPARRLKSVGSTASILWLSRFTTMEHRGHRCAYATCFRNLNLMDLAQRWHAERRPDVFASRSSGVISYSTFRMRCAGSPALAAREKTGSKSSVNFDAASAAPCRHVFLGLPQFVTAGGVAF